MEQHVNRHHVGVRQRVPFRRGAAAYASASYRSADAKNRLMLLKAVLVISDGVEAALGSAADALIRHPTAAYLLFAIAIFSACLRGNRRAWSFSDMIRTQGDRQQLAY